MRDVALYFRKKTGFPKLRDSGIADVVLGGQGMTVTIQVTSESKSHFKVVHNKRASMIQVGHPAGWVNWTTEREEKAKEGKEWRSEA
jgi:hypothetical protein